MILLFQIYNIISFEKRMSKKNAGHQPERFQVYQEVEDGSGFYLKDCDFFFEYDKHGGWRDEYGNYYDKNGDPSDEYEKQFGPSEDIQDDFEQQVPRNQKVLEKISQNMNILESHDANSPLRVNFQILDLDEEQDPPSQRKLFQIFSKKAKGIINVFYADDNQQEEDEEDDDESDEADENDPEEVDEEKEKTIQKEKEFQEKQEQTKMQENKKKEQEVEVKETEEKKQSQEKNEKGEEENEKKSEENENQQKEKVSNGYFVVKNVKSAEELIGMQGQNEKHDITFDVQPLNKLLVHSLKPHETKKMHLKYYCFKENQKAYFISLSEEGFEKKEHIEELFAYLQLQFKSILKMVKTEKGKKIPIVPLDEKLADELREKQYEGKKVQVKIKKLGDEKPNEDD